LWAHQIPYQKLLRIETLMEMSHWENWIIEEQLYNFTRYLISHTFPPTVYTDIYYVSKKLRKQTIFNKNTYFMIRNKCVEFQTFTTIIPQENLTSDCEIKQHTSQWRDKEDCSRSEVPFVVLIISMTVGTQNEAQLFHLNVTIFWHNPTAPSCACLILARFLQLSWQKLGSLIILAVELVTLQVLCYWPKNNSPVGKVSSIWWILLKFPDCCNSLCLLYTVWGLLCSRIIPYDRCSCLCLLIA